MSDKNPSGPDQATPKEQPSEHASGASAADDAAPEKAAIGATDAQKATPEKETAQKKGSPLNLLRGGTKREGATKDLDERCQKLENDLAEAKDRYMRIAAEMENLRKRTEREKIAFKKTAIKDFAKSILSIGDNLEMALSSVPKGAVATDPALKSLMDGVALTERELVSALGRHGVTRIDAKGRRFDPHLHQAMQQVNDPSVPNDTVIEVYQAGFMIEDQLLRPAMVVVAKGGPKGEAAAGSEGGPATIAEVTASSPSNDNLPETETKAGEADTLSGQAISPGENGAETKTADPKENGTQS